MEIEVLADFIYKQVLRIVYFFILIVQLIIHSFEVAIFRVLGWFCRGTFPLHPVELLKMFLEKQLRKKLTS